MNASVRSRFLFTVAANVLRSGLSFVTSLLLARWLMPSAYGDLMFVLGTFAGLRMALDLGSSTAFFTFLSQRPRSRRFVWTYFAWLAFQFAATFVAIWLALPARWVSHIWLGIPRGLVLLAFAAAFLQNTVWPVVQQAAESQRKTRWIQAVGAAVVAMHLAAVCALWLFGRLGLWTVLGAVVVEYMLAVVVGHRQFSYPATVAAEDEVGLAKYATYCSPLILCMLIGFAYSFADDWLLQAFGGGVQQAFYSVGAQFAAVAMIATNSIVNIFWKEIAEAHHRGDEARARTLYTRVSRLLFFIGAAIAGFLTPWAGTVLRLTLGSAYSGGALALAVMFVYSVHQCLGHITSAVLFATERVSLHATIGIAFMLLSMVATYFAVAPATAPIPGLGLGATGLAIKMVVMQLFQVNILSYAISRMWKVRFDWIYQPIALFGCLGFGVAAHLGALWLPLGGLPEAASLALSAAFYAPSIALFIYAFPGVAGLTREELAAEALKLVNAARGRFLDARQPLGGSPS